MTKSRIFIYLLIIGVTLILALAWYGFAFWKAGQDDPAEFNGNRALADVETQVSFGARIPGSTAHSHALEWMQTELTAAGWESRLQNAEMLGHPITNVIAQRGEAAPKIILAAHYDSRLLADQDTDPANRLKPVPGANDGASGVAVLLEMARVLPQDAPALWLVFFDAEDNGDIQGWDWILGSRAFVEQLETHPEAVVIVDMIGDADQNIYMEANSDPQISNEIWSIAAELGYEERFIPQTKYSMLDDHTPFLETGIPAIDIIDFDYPYWHTLADTPDKVSAESLEAVGRTLQVWLARYAIP